ncbi:MAG: hypothetical protein AYK18_15170 [Theionarchaea archaeon DG-70]|nr:MAG: hypothetical protein AYK18_15170 [Theionarchaea archaeon DG-70]
MASWTLDCYPLGPSSPFIADHHYIGILRAFISFVNKKTRDFIQKNQIKLIRLCHKAIFEIACFKGGKDPKT